MKLFRYNPSNPRREEVLSYLCAFIREARSDVIVKVQEPTRSLEQNARMWAMLHDLASQVLWPVDGEMQHMTPEEWKHVMSAGLKREYRVAQGMAGGFVILGQHTSKMSKAELSDLIDLIGAFGAEHSVHWSEPQHH